MNEETKIDVLDDIYQNSNKLIALMEILEYTEVDKLSEKTLPTTFNMMKEIIFHIRNEAASSLD